MSARYNKKKHDVGSIMPNAGYEPNPIVFVVSFDYGEGKWEQLIISVKPHQNSPLIFFV